MTGTLSGQHNRYLVATFPNPETKKSCKVTHALRGQTDFDLSTAALEAQRPWAVLGNNDCTIPRQGGFSPGTKLVIKHSIPSDRQDFEGQCPTCPLRKLLQSAWHPGEGREEHTMRRHGAQEADIHPRKEAQEFPGDAGRRFQHGSHTAGPRSRSTESKTLPKNDTLKRDQDNGQRSDGRKDR